MASNRRDSVIRGATVLNGTGAASFVGDPALCKDRIAAIGKIEDGAAAINLDARKFALAPGFIDVHSHEDFAVLTTPAMAAPCAGSFDSISSLHHFVCRAGL